MTSIMPPEALTNIHSTLLAYAPEQMCLLHCTNMSHRTSTVVYIWTHVTSDIHYKINKQQQLFTILLQNTYQQQICPSNATKGICSNYSMCICGGRMPKFMRHN